MAEPSVENDSIAIPPPPPFADNSSFDFELGSSISVDFELTFDDLYFPSESSPESEQVEKFEVEEEDSSTYETNKTKRKRGGEDTSMNSKYMRLDEDGDGDEEKRNARLVRNRESALLSRQRKKHYVEELEDKVKSMQSVITDLNCKVSYFMSENVTLRRKVGPGKGVGWSPSGMYPPLVPVAYPWMPFPAYQGSHQAVPLLPIPRLKPQRFLAKVKKSEAKTKKVASVTLLGLLFCLFLFGVVAPFVNVSYGEYDQLRGRVLDESVTSSSRAQSGRGSDQGVGRNVYVPLGNGSELLVASLFVPRNEQLVKLDGYLSIHSVSTREKDIASEMENAGRDISPALSSSGSDDSKDKLNTTTSNGEMQQWFREGVAGPMFSSEMCTEEIQLDVSSISGAIIPSSPATQQHKNTTDTRKGTNNRRSLRGGLPVSDSNLTKDQNSSNKENFGTTKPFPSMVVSVLVDPKEGSDGDLNGVTGGTKSLSQVFIVVLVDGVKYVAYSCVLPRLEEVPHLVTT